ncbi:transposase [Nodosilinea sp. LEGE 07298]|uniref:REP-associated tyrosine transposase n=1 Tax=Nodosilinea sp. LEGE 07298 TaxID=2777970 RepID=UPI00187EDAA2|nr:transposase [Nodosilinea sp. LEGE 07298]MBE9107826.1 transposase [Nodosilinea sp. LEGE 07298]
MRYRRAQTLGATYFFTVVTYNRQPLFHHDETIALLRKAFHIVKAEYPFTIDAIVILPDHIHSIWTLPEGDADFSSRWKRIKAWFSLRCPEAYKQQQSISRLRKGEQAIWQRRFWEHQIRNEADFRQHVDYIHYNPVKHNLVNRPLDWPYSSFHRYVADRAYPADWGATRAVEFDENIGRE